MSGTWRVFLAATLLLPLWRGDRLDEVQAKMGGVSIVSAATSTTSTKKTKDVQLGEVVQIGTARFVKIDANSWQAVEPYTCADPVLTYAGAVKNFDYTGGEQTYTAYAGCQYKLEVWGAQGGSVTCSSGTHEGGYGGYSIGSVHFTSVATIYINVGGQGNNARNNCAYTSTGGSYNGGGATACQSNSYYGGGGGGATHMAYVGGLIKNVSVGDLLIVAGGGGGSSDANSHGMSDTYGLGANGGGYIGNTATNNRSGRNAGGGGSQTTGGNTVTNNTPPQIISGYGQGCSPTANYGAYMQVAGGGGFYGGGCGTHNGGGGGSGYIASSNLISAAGVTKHMTCYNCTTSTADATRTQSNTCVNATATADCSKTGNGYARIIRLN